MGPDEGGFRLDGDDLPVGRVLSRRKALRALGVAAPAVLLAGTRGADPRGPVGAGTTRCVAKPRLAEGPYYVDTGLNRSDIRADAATGEAEAGATLVLAFAVSRVSAQTCAPLDGAVVDVWHCNALGVYSGVEDPNFGSTVGSTWLRGHQVTGADGRAAFTTIFPGWYPGRASHIHFTIRSNAGGSGYTFTSQLFFEEALLERVYASAAPYTDKEDAGRVRNADDGIYRRGGDQLLLRPVAEGDGYRATFDIGLAI